MQRKIIFSSTEPFAKETFLTMMNRLYLSSVQRNTIRKGPNFFPSLAPLIFNYKSCILPPPPSPWAPEKQFTNSGYVCHLKELRLFFKYSPNKPCSVFYLNKGVQLLFCGCPKRFTIAAREYTKSRKVPFFLLHRVPNPKNRHLLCHPLATPMMGTRAIHY